MAELAAIGLVASIATSVDLSAKVTARLHESTDKTSDVPELFRSLRTRLPLLTDALQRIESQAEAGRFPHDATKSLKAVVDNTTAQVSDVQTLLSKVLPSDGASKLNRAVKALKSLANEDKVQQALEKFEKNNEILVLYQTTRNIDKSDSILKEVSKLGTPTLSIVEPSLISFIKNAPCRRLGRRSSAWVG